MVKYLVVSLACWMTSLAFASTQDGPLEKLRLSQADYIYLHMVQSGLGKPAGLANTPDTEVHTGKDLVFLNPEKTEAELEVKVVVNNPAKTQALATLVTQTQDCGGVLVHVYVADFQGNRVEPQRLPSTLKEAKQLFTDALSGNWYFLRIQSGSQYVPFFVEVRYQPVQFFNDSLLSRIACGTQTSETVFTQLCQVEKLGKAGVRMSFTTQELSIPSSTNEARRAGVRKFLKRALRACSRPFSCCYERQQEDAQ